MKKYLNKYNTSFGVMMFLLSITLCVVSATVPALVVLLVLDAISYVVWKVVISGMTDEELCEKMGFKGTIFDFTKE